jgi:hypothetical protein
MSLISIVLIKNGKQIAIWEMAAFNNICDMVATGFCIIFGVAWFTGAGFYWYISYYCMVCFLMAVPILLIFALYLLGTDTLLLSG